MTSALKKTQSTSVDNKLEHLKRQMQEQRLNFVKATKDYVVDWYQTVADNFYLLNKDITTALTEQQKYTFIDGLRNLQSSSLQKVELLTTNPSLWWDLDSSSNSDNDRYKDIESFLPMEFRYILGDLGILLVEYGYIVRSKFGDSGFAAEQSGTGGYIFKFQDLYFPSDQMKRSFDKYWELYKFAIRLR